MKRCRTCLLTSRVQGLSFDDRGVCSECVTRPKPPNFPPRYPEKLLRALRSRCAVGFSGGKDSAFILHSLTSELATRADHKPLALTVDTGFLSPVGWRNILEVPGRLGVEHRILRPARGDFVKIYREHLDAVPDAPFQLCAFCTMRMEQEMLRQAEREGIRHVLVGTSIDQLGLVKEWRWTDRILHPLLIWRCRPAMVRAELARRGLLTQRRSSPMTTNCRMNWVIMDRFISARGYNPYLRMFSEQVRLGWASRKRLIALDRLVMALHCVGYLRHKAKEVLREF